MSNKPDILIFFSDQHNAMYAGFAGDSIVKTPNLDRIASNGVTFDAAYTSCPLCVPARMSMLTGQLPARTGIYSNSGAIGGDQATFIHSLAAEGYETVLCGRMHFMGEDQRHGFTKRIMGEMTPLVWGRGGDKREDLGPYVSTLAHRYMNVIGGGTSPVLEYDRAVIEAALQYLNQPHDKPQCIVVGTYAPHHTYVAPPDLYEYYKKTVELPVSLTKEPDYDHPISNRYKNEMDQETIRKIRAAYFGMITNLDEQIGQVYEAWKEYLNNNDRKGIFIYISDHGDQAGERHLYGKQTFFEGSAKIPLIFEGEGIQVNKRVKGSVSIMDIGPTLCEMVGAITPPDQDGKSLLKQITSEYDDTSRYVISEFVEYINKEYVPGRMVRYKNWKYISYAFHDEYDLMFDVESDPYELHNIIKENPQKAEELKEMLKRDWDVDNIIKTNEVKAKHHWILAKWGAAVDVKEEERWVVTDKARELPIIE